jgi:hypothetical protein
MRCFLRRALLLVLIISIASMFVWHFTTQNRIVARTISASGVSTITLLTRSHTIDRLYPSMHGPMSQHESIGLLEQRNPELIWLTGIDSELVDADTEQVISPEFFCHSNLTLTNMERDRTRTANITPCAEGRLFTLVPGRLSIRLPEGFGIPLYADESVDHLTMALNLNEQPKPVDIRFRTNVQFVRESTLQHPLKPLFRRSVYGYEPIGKASPHTMCMGGDNKGAACGPFITTAASTAFLRSLGTTNTVHWMIPPGHYESHVDVTDQIQLPFDTTAHYVTGHLHPFGKSIQLIDKTLDQVVLTIKSKDWHDKRGVAAIDEISTPDGIALHNDHAYELVTTYHNPTREPIDAMSILYVYALDKQMSGGK